MANADTTRELLQHPFIPGPEQHLPRTKKDIALRVLLARNSALNKSTPDLRLAEKPTPALEATAQKLADLQELLKKRGGTPLVRSFLEDPYTMLWFEQIAQIDPNKIVLAAETKNAVDALTRSHQIDRQHAPAMALGAFVGIEKLEELNLTFSPSRIAVKVIQTMEKRTPAALRGEISLLRNLRGYLSDIDRMNPTAVGIEREGILRDKIALDIARRLQRQELHAKLLQQSQGSEVEMLQRLEYLPPEQRETGTQKYRLGWVDRFDLKAWLPRGIRQDQHKRMDWHLTHMLGLPEDIAEKAHNLEWYEVTAKPTESGADQSTLLYELVLGGFVSEDILSNTREKYSLHISTVFPSAIWNEKSEKQYLLFARGFAGAFSSVQRGVYGGYVSNDSNAGRPGREIADKTFQANKMTPVEGKPGVSVRDMHLVEIRMFDLTEKGQYAIEIYKPYFDFAFRSFWVRQEGLPLANPAQYRAANLWQTFNSELHALYKRYDIQDDWRSVGWTKANKPELQKELASLYRKFGHQLNRLVDNEVQTPSREVKPDGLRTPILFEKRHIQKEPLISGERTDPRVALPAEDMAGMHLTDGQFVTFRFGESKISAIITRAAQQAKPSEITLSPDIYESIHLWDDLSLSVRFDPVRNEISLGPALGIMVSKEDLSLGQPFNDQSRFLAHNLRIAGQHGIGAYLFDPGNLDAENRTINAWTLSPDGKSFREITVPFPDSIYDRTFQGIPPASRYALRHIPYVNSREFTLFIADKLELSKLLRSNSILKEYVPETRKFTDAQSLTDMLSKHRTVFLKPTWGMMSRAVVKVERLDDGSYRYIYTRPQYANGNVDYSWPEPTDADYEGFIAHSVQEVLDKTAEPRKGFSEFIMQQGIDMPYDKSWGFFETRFLLQRGTTGSLDIIGWNEGQKKHDVDLFAKRFGEENATTILTNAERLAKAAGLQIQKGFGSRFGQMTVQVAIDRNGKVWFMEANPKPGVVNQFDNRNLPHLTDSAIAHALEYQRGISGYSEQSIPTKRFGTVTLQNGTRADIYEENNPLAIYRFAVDCLGPDIVEKEKSVYNLRQIEKIQENLARGARYIMIRNTETGKVLGTISIHRPSAQAGFDIESKEPIMTRWRWEIGGVLTHPEATGRGIAGVLFDTAVSDIRQAQPVYDTDNGRPVDEIRVDVTGTFNKEQMGQVRPESIGIDKIVARYPHRVIGGVPGSYGPMYAIPIETHK